MPAGPVGRDARETLWHILFLALVVGTGVCVPATTVAEPAAVTGLRPLPTPAAPKSGEPCLAVGPDGAIYMSWFEKLDKGHALRIARLQGERWSKPSTVAEGDSFFVNWADFPQIAALDQDRLAIAWPWKRPGGTYAYDVRVALSRDRGRSWSRPTIPHRDDTPTEHGFVSLVPERGGVRVVWLDGRRFMEKKPQAAAPDATGGHDEEHGGEMTLRTAWIGPDLALSQEAELDGRVCDCCQTGAAATAAGVFVAYRDRGEEEIRDISAVRLEGGRWTAPATVADDGWKISACPVNGPAVDAAGSRVVVAWFTGAQDSGRVRVAFSTDGGRGFTPPVDLPSSDPLGRPGVLLLEDGSALVSWMDAHGKEAEIQMSRVTAGGEVGPAMTVARTSAARASGFPRMARSGKRVIFAWTETGAQSQVRVARAYLP